MQKSLEAACEVRCLCVRWVMLKGGESKWNTNKHLRHWTIVYIIIWWYWSFISAGKSSFLFVCFFVHDLKEHYKRRGTHYCRYIQINQTFHLLTSSKSKFFLSRHRSSSVMPLIGSHTFFPLMCLVYHKCDRELHHGELLGYNSHWFDILIMYVPYMLNELFHLDEVLTFRITLPHSHGSSEISSLFLNLNTKDALLVNVVRHVYLEYSLCHL